MKGGHPYPSRVMSALSMNLTVLAQAPRLVAGKPASHNKKKGKEGQGKREKKHSRRHEEGGRRRVEIGRSVEARGSRSRQHCLS